MQNSYNYLNIRILKMSMFLEYAKKESNDRTKGDGDDTEAAKKSKNSSNFVLKDSIEQVFAKMVKDAYNDKEKRIPPGFDEFCRS